MRQINRLAAAAGILAVVTAGHADTILRQRSFDLSRAGDPSYFQNYKTQVQSIDTDEEGLTRAHLYFPQTTASFGRASTSYSEDWSAYNILEFKMTNHEAFPVEFRALVYLNQDSHNSTGAFSGRVTLGPGETRRFCCYLNPDDSMPYGMEYLRPVLSAAYNNVYCSGGFRNLSNVYTWRLSYQGTVPAHVDFSELRLIKQDLTFDNMVDAFGQYQDREWANKVHSVNDFAALQANELTDLAANPATQQQLGSVQVPLTTGATGKWEVTTSLSGKKYLEHPNGNAFWILGVSAIHNGTPTPVGGREGYFQSLPSTSSNFASCYYSRPTMDGSNTCYSFHQQNLMLKYGQNYMGPWTSMVKQRLSSWGLNTLGIQCLTPFYDNSTPYTQLLTTGNFPVRFKVPKQLWGSFPDPFDANFQSWMTTQFAKDLAPWNGQQNFIGVYVDNELSWGNTMTDPARYNLSLGALKAAATQPAKAAFASFLSTRYKNDISKLNAGWGTSYASFDAIRTTTNYAPQTFTPAQASDFKAWSKAFSGQYFKSVRAALSADNLSGLYLGCRYADWLPEVVEGADPFVDVHTLNFYRSAPYMNWGYWSGPTLKKPYMFSETGASVDADGTFGGVGEVYSQNDRANNMIGVLSRAILEPNCVGAVLYCYTDQPVTGRYTDYENSGLGLVDVTDTPHYEAINVIRNFSKSMYANRG
jgi:hypothetical protein